MRCSICFGEIKDKSAVKILHRDICMLCITSIIKISVNNIFYDYYRDRIKDIERAIIHNPN